MRHACLTIILMIMSATVSLSGSWVASPTSVDATQGLLGAGDHCAAWASHTGERLLFFDAWSGTWTERTLPGTHTLVRVLGDGELMLVVFEELAVVFHGRTQSVHTRPLDGALLDVGYNRPSFGCAEELAVVVTDDVFYVFDARRETWLTLDYAEPAGAVTFGGVVAESDYVATDLAPAYPTPAINLAYSLRTGTFLETHEGINGILSGHVLDHGFAGLGGFWPDLAARGYSAFTGEMTTGYVDTEGEIECFTVDRTRRTVSHLLGFARDVYVAYQTRAFHQWIYDSIRGTWSDHGYEYDTSELNPGNGPHLGGRIAGHVTLAEDDEYSLLLFDGRTHEFWSASPGLYGSSLGNRMGGTVAAFLGDTDAGDPLWWCCSLAHPEGTPIVCDHEFCDDPIAGDRWFAATMHSADGPERTLHFYHGPTNHVTSVTVPQSLGVPTARAHVYSVARGGSDPILVFYSGLLDQVEQRTPTGTAYWTRSVNDRLALYHSGDLNYLFDAQTGAVTSRTADFTSNSLGGEIVIGHDPGTATAHGYSALTGSWHTHLTDDSCHGAGGGVVGYVRTADGSRFWGFDGATGSWSILETTGSFLHEAIGGTTVIVGSTDRAWAFFPTGGVIGVDDEPVADRAIMAAALADARCSPNPFNGRTTVTFRLPAAATVEVAVYDPRGHHIATLLDAERPPGPVVVPWQTDRVASGTYLVRIIVDGQTVTRKVALVQ
ncbi:T9SS type A sorting domain-containing protein [bacterium]|nr:T9SS type A sorting domain-containing protein [bacterium]